MDKKQAQTTSEPHDTENTSPETPSRTLGSMHPLHGAYDALSKDIESLSQAAVTQEKRMRQHMTEALSELEKSLESRMSGRISKLEKRMEDLEERVSKLEERPSQAQDNLVTPPNSPRASAFQDTAIVAALVGGIPPSGATITVPGGGQGQTGVPAPYTAGMGYGPGAIMPSGYGPGAMPSGYGPGAIMPSGYGGMGGVPPFGSPFFPPGAFGSPFAPFPPSFAAALFSTVQSGDAESVQKLLAMGADPNARDPNGSTVLHWAARSDNEAMVRALLAAGADRLACDAQGHLPYQVATSSNVRRLLCC